MNREPSRAMWPTAPKISMVDGVIARGNAPLRAKTSQARMATPNAATARATDPARPAVIATSPSGCARRPLIAGAPSSGQHAPADDGEALEPLEDELFQREPDDADDGDPRQ